jgi:hypothetical protein
MRESTVCPCERPACSYLLPHGQGKSPLAPLCTCVDMHPCLPASFQDALISMQLVYLVLLLHTSAVGMLIVQCCRSGLVDSAFTDTMTDKLHARTLTDVRIIPGSGKYVQHCTVK